MSADDTLREIAERNGWAPDLLLEMRTLLAAECNAAFDHGRQVEREAWRMQYGIVMYSTMDDQS